MRILRPTKPNPSPHSDADVARDRRARIPRVQFNFSPPSVRRIRAVVASSSPLSRTNARPAADDGQPWKCEALDLRHRSRRRRRARRVLHRTRARVRREEIFRIHRHRAATRDHARAMPGRDLSFNLERRVRGARRHRALRGWSAPTPPLGVLGAMDRTVAIDRSRGRCDCEKGRRRGR